MMSRAREIPPKIALLLFLCANVRIQDSGHLCHDHRRYPLHIIGCLSSDFDNWLWKPADDSATSEWKNLSSNENFSYRQPSNDSSILVNSHFIDKQFHFLGSSLCATRYTFSFLHLVWKSRIRSIQSRSINWLKMYTSYVHWLHFHRLSTSSV